MSYHSYELHSAVIHRRKKECCQTVDGSHWLPWYFWLLMVTINCLVKMSCFVFNRWKKLTVLEQLEGEWWQNVHFGVNYPFKRDNWPNKLSHDFVSILYYNSYKKLNIKSYKRKTVSSVFTIRLSGKRIKIGLLGIKGEGQTCMGW